MSLNESIFEVAALTWFGEPGYAIGLGPQLEPGESAAERDSYGEVVLARRFGTAIDRLNPAIPSDPREEALRKILRHDEPSLAGNAVCFIARCATVFLSSIGEMMEASLETTSG